MSDLLVNEVVAALFKEFDETTPQNVEHGKQAISLIFNDVNRDIRLVGAFGPLLGGDNDRPGDRFETTALRRALTGESYTAVQKVNDTWYYRRSVPLSNTLHQNCVLCHTNFTADFFNSTHNPGQWVGTLVLGVRFDRPTTITDDDGTRHGDNEAHASGVVMCTPLAGCRPEIVPGRARLAKYMSAGRSKRPSPTDIRRASVRPERVGDGFSLTVTVRLKADTTGDSRDAERAFA